MAQTSEMVVARMFPFAFTGDAGHRAIVLSREPEWKIRWILCYGSIWVMGFRVKTINNIKFPFNMVLLPP
jgi:hypothetical protein